MSNLGFELLVRFAWGSFLALTLVDRRETTERFPRIAAWILAVIALCAYGLARSGTPELVDYRTYASIALAAGALLYAYGRARAVRIIGFLTALAGPFALAALGGPRATLNFVTSALLLGSVFAGQYLGHWFLTVPGLHIKEFQKVVKLLIVAIIARVCEVAFTLFITIGLHPHEAVDAMGRPLLPALDSLARLQTDAGGQSLLALSGDSWFGLEFFGLLLLATRVLWGLIAPVLLVGMVKKTVDTRSTQSATGILYALCVMVLLGEGTALYFLMQLRWPL